MSALLSVGSKLSHTSRECVPFIPVVFQEQCTSQKSISHATGYIFLPPLLCASCQLCSLFSVTCSPQNSTFLRFCVLRLPCPVPSPSNICFKFPVEGLFVCNREMSPRGVTLLSPFPHGASSPTLAVPSCPISVCSAVNVCCIQLQVSSSHSPLQRQVAGVGTEPSWWVFFGVQSHLEFPAKRAIQ